MNPEIAGHIIQNMLDLILAWANYGASWVIRLLFLFAGFFAAVRIITAALSFWRG